MYASLHVRVSNRGAFHLYTQTLGYSCVSSLINAQSLGQRLPDQRCYAP